MQMTYEQAARPGMLLAFATRRGSGYMMRSEKRGGPYGNGSGRRPPKRKKAGFAYIFLTMLVCILLWPVGMAMLWRRKVRLQAGTKLLISLLTLCLSVFLIVFALTVPVDNPQFTAFQDKANDWLSQAEKDVAVAGDAAIKKAGETWNVMADFSEAESDYALVQGADAIDKGVEWAGQARASIEKLFNRPTPEPTAIPTDEPTEAPTEAATETPTEEATEAATEKPTKKPRATKQPTEEATEAVTEEPTGAATEAVTEEPTEAATEAVTDAPTEAPTDNGDGADALDIHLPEAEPDAQDAQALGAGTLHADGSFEPAPEPEATEAPEETEAPEATEAAAFWTAAEDVTAEPTEAPADEATEVPVEEPTEVPTDEATEEPTEAPTEVPAAATYTVKPAAEATVYYFENGSKGFHRTPTSHDLNMPAHTLTQAFADGKSPCNSCGMPAEDILSEEHVAWVDGNNTIHTTDECPAFSGDWKLVSLADALEADGAPCPDCGAEAYCEAVFPAPTPTPEPQVVAPATPLEPADDIAVYYFDISRGYHAAPDCVGMSNAPAHTLAEALADGKHTCGNCNPPSTDFVGKPALWLDENGLCHTGRGCAAFAGGYKLILRDDALAQGLTPCPDCGAADYLIPGTILAETQQ